MNCVPIKIKREQENLLYAEWDDGFSSTIKLEVLRRECPCANCKDENSQANKLAKYMLPSFKQGKNQLTKLSPVGNYAINAVWGDGHDSGIYPWEYFRAIFENFKLSEKEIEDYVEAKKNEPKIPDLNIRGN